ncbi:MAG: cupin domain-containing protein [Rhodospirillales bacterium]|nr:cupin domain-containing protein [Rhodospirillales bacterium]
MMEQQRGERAPAYTVDGSEVISEAPGLRVVVLTLGPGQSIPWHWHSAVTDEAFGLEGELEVELRAPRETHRLTPGKRSTVPPKRAHRVVNVHGGTSRFLLVQGGGRHDFNPVGG